MVCIDISWASLLHQVIRLQEAQCLQTFYKKRQFSRKKETLPDIFIFILEFWFWGIFFRFLNFCGFLSNVICPFSWLLCYMRIWGDIWIVRTVLTLCQDENLCSVVMKGFPWVAGKEWIILLCLLSTCISKKYVLICFYVDQKNSRITISSMRLT